MVVDGDEDDEVEEGEGDDSDEEKGGVDGTMVVFVYEVVRVHLRAEQQYEEDEENEVGYGSDDSAKEDVHTDALNGVTEGALHVLQEPVDHDDPHDLRPKHIDGVDDDENELQHAEPIRLDFVHFVVGESEDTEHNDRVQERFVQDVLGILLVFLMLFVLFFFLLSLLLFVSLLLIIIIISIRVLIFLRLSILATCAALQNIRPQLKPGDKQYIRDDAKQNAGHFIMQVYRGLH